MRIVSANFYVGNRTVKADAHKLDGLNATALGLQEASFADDDIMRVMRDGYYLFGAGEGGRSGQEVPILLNKKATYLGDGAYLVSERVNPDNKGIAPDRYLTWVRFEWQSRKYVLINMHPNAAVQSSAGGPLSRRYKRVREFAKSMRELEEEIQQQQADGFTVIVTGDLNYRHRYGISMWKWSPSEVFRRNRLAFHAEGLDYVAWDKRKLTKANITIIPKTKTGSDHPWVIADLAATGA